MSKADTYEIGFLTTDLTGAEISALMSMFEHPGWAVFKKIRSGDIASIMSSILEKGYFDENGQEHPVDPRIRDMHIATYHALNADLTIDEEMKGEVTPEMLNSL